VRWHRDLANASGQNIGRIEAGICHNETELNDCIGFSRLSGGFGPYAAQIPISEIWPIAVLLDLEIYQVFRRSGFGRVALHQFLGYAQAKQAKIAFLRVGWYGDDPDAERAWRIAWYSREGFRELANPSPKILIPFMYRLL